ncbi:MAG: YcgN family cysteine cluster protein [Agarilytica sp.]
MPEPAFWQTKALTEMSRDEWESLCDGCAKCCLHKLEDEDTGEVYYTDVVCRYMDEETCSCTDYQNRSTLVPNCITLTPENVFEHDWLPQTCAYRLLAEGKSLYDWHPLVSGSSESVHDASMSVRYRGICEDRVQPDELEDRIIYWVV